MIRKQYISLFSNNHQKDYTHMQYIA